MTCQRQLYLEVIMFIDTHTHLAHFSSDGKQSIEELLSQAQKSGLAGVCITDHYEKDVIYIPGREEIFDLDEYFQLLQPLQKSVRTQGGELLIGIELGWMPGKEEHYARLLRRPFDSVLLSLHILDGEDPYSDQHIYRTDKQSLYKRYLKRLGDIVSSFPDFDILAHFDYISRYAPYEDQKMRYSEMPAEFDSFLSQLIARDKCLEINTATIARLQKCGYSGSEAWPDAKIIEAYRRLGGQKISLGSDAHTPAHLGRFLPQTAKWLADIGFSETVAYRARRAISGKAI